MKKLEDKKGIIEITFEEEREILELPSKPELPKYASQLINLANIFSQGTRPKVVGQMSELIKEFRKTGGRTFEDWKKWYLQKYPNAIDEATEKIWNMLNNFKETLEQLERDDVRKWVEDLVLIKTYEGLMLQDAILKKVAEELGGNYRPSTIEEESKGIDGVIIIDDKEIPVSIKSKTYVNQEKHLSEELKGHLIIYEKKKNKIIVDYSDLLDLVENTK
ncbi:MjaI family restriction endonuclease [Methanocaldococcus jannaschii]|nr:MjaI family restriction endonuclease [Methanocaldococcus jannaschii]